jgi:hypothetical protein
MSSVVAPRSVVRLRDQVLNRSENPKKPGPVQKAVDGYVTALSLTNLGKGVGEKTVQVGKNIALLCGASQSSASMSLFSKVFSVICAPFNFISAFVSVYFVGKDVLSLASACRNKDHESGYESSLSLISNTASIGESGLSGVIAGYKIQGAFAIGAQAAAQSSQSVALLAPAAIGFGVGVFTTYSALQVLSLSRVSAAIRSIQHIFHPPGKSVRSDLDKYKEAMKEIVSRTTLTECEEEKIQKKAQEESEKKKSDNESLNQENFNRVYKKEKTRLLEKKKSQLIRRLGLRATEEMFKSASQLSKDLDSDDPSKRTEAIKESEKLFKVYKGALHKKLFVNSLKFVAGILGVIGSSLLFATPIGAAIASGLLVGSAVGLLLGTYFIENKMKDSKFENGIRIGKKRFSCFEIPKAATMTLSEPDEKKKIRLLSQSRLRRAKPNFLARLRFRKPQRIFI